MKTVILGIGANIGDRLENFRKAILALKKLDKMIIQQISPLYISEALLPENAPKDWDKPYLNFAIRLETELSPENLLKELKNIEWTIGRKPEIRHWGPRLLDIDILAYDHLQIKTDALTIPHTHLTERPWALWPLADVAPDWIYPLTKKNEGNSAKELVLKWGSRFSGQAPFKTKQILNRIDIPRLMGILNITPDSFSDGGEFFNDPEKAIIHINKMVESGAEIIDIGAESTAPNRTLLTHEEEWKRLFPILKPISEIKKNCPIEPKICIDTRHALTAIKAIELGATIINDVSGMQNKAMRDVIKQSRVSAIFMHHLTIPANKNIFLSMNKEPEKMVYEWAKNKLNECKEEGILEEQLIFDPGIGFGKTKEQDISLLKHINQFTSLGVKILVGHSRKYFLTSFTDREAKDRDIETLAVSLFLSSKDVDYLRIHDVEMCARALRVMKAI